MFGPLGGHLSLSPPTPPSCPFPSWLCLVLGVFASSCARFVAELGSVCRVQRRALVGPKAVFALLLAVAAPLRVLGCAVLWCFFAAVLFACRCVFSVC